MSAGQSPRRQVLQRLRRATGVGMSRRVGIPTCPGSRFCNECGKPLSAAVPAPCSRSAELHSPPPRREDPHLPPRARGRAQAGDGAVRRHQRLARAARPTAIPEEARKLLDPVLERMMEAVHRYEGTVNQVMGDGIMALFGAPLAHEDHAVRACYAALAMQQAIHRYTAEVRREPRHRGPDPRRASTPARWSCARSGAICAWTTRRWARPRTSPRGWSSSRPRARRG